MRLDILLNFVCIACQVSAIICFVVYAIDTKKIIASQKREIARLQTQLKREKQREHVQIVYNGKNPKFGDF